MTDREPAECGLSRFQEEVRHLAYARIDDDFADHRRVLAIPRKERNAAIGVYTRGLCYCQRHESDGFIPAGKFDTAEDEEPVAALVACGLWSEVDGGYEVNDYLEWNKSRTEIDEIRAKRRECGRLGGRPPKQDESNLVSGCFDVRNPDTDTDTKTDTKEREKQREEAPPPPSNPGDSFPPCLNLRFTRKGHENTLRGHVLLEAENRLGAAWVASIPKRNKMGTAITDGCPTGCDGNEEQARRCATSFIRSINEVADECVAKGKQPAVGLILYQLREGAR